MVDFSLRSNEVDLISINRPRSPNSNTLRAEEVEVAADFVILNGVDNAVDVGLLINEVDQHIRLLKMKIGDIALVEIEVGEVIDSSLATVSRTIRRDVSDLAIDFNGASLRGVRLLNVLCQ